ncbi:hypothetical protein BDV98DRAFT_638951 [Pterulicium gracile]|uniref:Uncharacterized protein n=1 Tax=Pterulicium gracile TaxID=1884261 RepID=A0A5C3Q231_9AGAR|nr:hypothetical protein BDV98DRAFT_638951 [Pterula gracilis]
MSMYDRRITECQTMCLPRSLGTLVVFGRELEHLYRASGCRYGASACSKFSWLWTQAQTQEKSRKERNVTLSSSKPKPKQRSEELRGREDYDRSCSQVETSWRHTHAKTDAEGDLSLGLRSKIELQEQVRKAGGGPPSSINIIQIRPSSS